MRNNFYVDIQSSRLVCVWINFFYLKQFIIFNFFKQLLKNKFPKNNHLPNMLQARLLRQIPWTSEEKKKHEELEMFR